MVNKKIINIKNKEFLTRKIIYSIIVAILASIVVSFSSIFVFSFSGFLILFAVYLFSIWELETKEYISYYSVRAIKNLFFFLPLAAIFYSIAFTSTMVSSSEDSLTAWASAIWGAIWWFMIIFLCLIIWIVWGLIIWTFAKKPKSEQNTWKSMWILFLVVIILSIYYLNQPSELEKTLNWTTSELNNDSGLVTTSWSGTLWNKLSDDKTFTKLLDFKLTNYVFVNWDWFDNFEFSYDLTNNSWKDILGYKWSFEVFDMFDDRLSKFNIDRIWDFGSWTTIREKGTYSYNEFLSDDIKLAKSNYEDLKYKHTITDIVYKDEYDFTNKIFWNNTWTDINKINYEIINKTSTEWTFQNYVDFTIKITNNSEKDIKGIKWSFYIYNIFWEKLWSYELNLTKQIKVWSSLSESMQYSINEYINTEYEIFESDFNMLKYNFDIKNVVYIE